jgi:hypothetical protein
MSMPPDLPATVMRCRGSCCCGGRSSQHRPAARLPLRHPAHVPGGPGRTRPVDAPARWRTHLPLPREKHRRPDALPPIQPFPPALGRAPVCVRRRALPLHRRIHPRRPKPRRPLRHRPAARGRGGDRIPRARRGPCRQTSSWKVSPMPGAPSCHRHTPLPTAMHAIWIPATRALPCHNNVVMPSRGRIGRTRTTLTCIWFVMPSGLGCNGTLLNNTAQDGKRHTCSWPTTATSPRRASGCTTSTTKAPPASAIPGQTHADRTPDPCCAR